MNRVSIFGSGHLTKSFLYGLNRAFDIEISIYNRTLSNAIDLKKIYHNLNVVKAPLELISENTLLFYIIPAQAILSLDWKIIEKIKKTNSIIISCANGLTLDNLFNIYKDNKVIRLLPNINWRICEGVSLFDINEKVENDDLIDFFSLLKPITTLYRVKSDEEFNSLGTLTTCSPGLLCEILDCFLYKFKLLEQDEQKLFYQSIKGTVNYILNANKSINDISLEVANKGGLTEVGIKTLQELFPACMDQVIDNMQNKINSRTTQINKAIQDHRKITTIAKN